MKLAILAAFALVMGIGSITCIPEPAPLQTAYPCPSANCALPEPQPFQTAYPCPAVNCAIPEPVETQTA